MAAYEASIFKTLEEADSEIYEIFLDIAVEKLHLKQGGIQAPIFHPLDFFKPNKPFWERVINSVTEEDELTRLSGWALFTIPLKELNVILTKKNVFPEGIESSDFEAFIRLCEKKAILHYLLGDVDRCLITTSAVQAQLQFVQFFCAQYELDMEVLKNYEELSHVFGAEFDDSKASQYTSSYVVKSSSIQISNAMLEQKEGFLICRKVLLLDILQLEEQRRKLDKKIKTLCEDKRLDKDAIMDLAKKGYSSSDGLKDVIELAKEDYSDSGGLKDVIGLAEEDYSSSDGLKNVTHLAKKALALDEKIEKRKSEIDQVKRSLKALRYTKAYEEICTYLKDNFSISSKFFAGKVIAICGHGLKHPYTLPLTEKEHRTFLEKRLNTKLIEIKNEIYYRTAERGLFAIQNNPNSPLLERPRHFLDYITQMIELGSYETNIFNSEKIDYSISVEKVEKVANKVENEVGNKVASEMESEVENKVNTKVEILRKQKSIPDFLYDYYSQLQKIKNSLNFESMFYSAIIDLKLLPPQENEIHYKWHLKFLNQLKSMVQEEKMISAMPLQTFPNASLSSSSSLLSSRISFQGEDAKKRISTSDTPESISPESPRLE